MTQLAFINRTDRVLEPREIVGVTASADTYVATNPRFDHEALAFVIDQTKPNQMGRGYVFARWERRLVVEHISRGVPE